MPRVLRIARAMALVVLGLLTVVAGTLVVASRTGIVQAIVRRQVVAALERALTGQVTLGGTSGTVGRSLVLHDLRIAVDGRTVVAIPRAEVVYALGPLLRGRLRLRRVVLTAPRIHARRAASGWVLPHTRSTGDTPSRHPTVEIDHLEVRDGRVAVALADASPPRRFAATALQLTGSATFGTDERSVHLLALDCVPRGLALTPVHASGTLATTGDTIAVRDLDVGTRRSRLVTTGDATSARHLDGRLLLAPLDAREVRAVLPGLRLRSDVRAVVQASGPWNGVGVGLRANLGAGGTARARATLDLAADPATYDLMLRIATLDPAAIADGLPAATLNGRARLRGAGAGIDAPLRYAVKLGPSRLAGHALDALTTTGEAAGGAHRADVHLTAPAGTVAARVRVAAAPRVRYRLSGRAATDHLEYLLPTLFGRVDLRFSAAGDGLATPDRRAAARVRLTGATLRGVGLARGQLRARLAGDQLALTPVAVEGPALRANGAARLDLDRRVATAEVHAAAALPALAGLRNGSTTLDATFRGPLDRLAVHATGNVRAAQTSRASVDQATLTLDLADVGAITASGRARLEAGGIRLDAGAPRDAVADATWRRVDGEDTVDLTLTGHRAGAVSERLALGLVRAADRIAGQLRELTVTPDDQPPWQLARPARFEIADGALVTTGMTLASAEQRLAFAGRAGIRGPLDGTLEATRLRLAPFCALAPGPPCQGELGGRLKLAGTAADPRFAATLTAAAVRVDDVPYGDVHVELGYAARRASIDAALHHPGAGDLHLDGSVPLDLAWETPPVDLASAPVDLHLHAAHLDLTFVRALAPRTLRQTAGRLTVDLRVDGSRAAPDADGTVMLKDGRLELAVTGIPYEDVEADLALAGDQVEVRRLRARAGDGTLDGRGRLALGGERALDATVRLESFLAVRREDLEAQTDGTLVVGGTLASPDVHGTLDVTRALVRPAALPVSGPSLERDATIVVIGRPAPPAEPAATPAGRLADALRLGIEVRLARNVWIRRADASIELGGAVTITKPSGEPVRLSGVIRLLRGWYAFQGRRFDIDEGTIRFVGAVPPTPVFDITASHKTADYRITVRIAGSGTKPELKLSSDPPLEQADVLSVILFGKPASALGRGESVGLQRQALQLASGYVAPELRTSVMNSLGLDVLDVELQQGTENPGRVTVGRYVATDVFVSLAQEFGSRAAQVVGVEYGLTPRISVKGSTSTRGDSAVDLFWHHRY